MTETSAFLGD